MSMSFDKIMQEYSTLARGHAEINLPPTVTLKASGQLLAEQREGLVHVLSEMVDEDLADLDQGLKEAATGLQSAHKKLGALRTVAKKLKESGQVEMPKLAVLIEKIEASYEDVGTTLKELLTGTKAALRVQTGDESD